MENWEFLIQKEGDRAWLPLESPDVEILEGRYRVVARSSGPNETVEIRVVHDSTEEIPPKRRIQKRSRQISAEGLVVIIPFTRLKPRIWELRCTGGDVMSDLLGKTWNHSVKLQVLPIDADDVSLLDSDEPAEATVGRLEIPATVIQESAAAAVNFDLDDMTPPETQVPQPVSKSALEESLPNTDLPNEPAPAGKRQPLQLILNQEIYVRRGPALTVSGRVDVPYSATEVFPLSGVEVHIELRDPQNSRVLADVRETLPKILPPVPFACAIEIPPQCDSRLILGAISLYDGTADAVDTKSFSITAEVEDLLDAISEELSEQDLADLSFYPTAKRRAEAVNQSFTEIVDTIYTPRQVQFQPSTDQPLPPLLYKPDSGNTPSKPLELPAFPRFNQNAPNSKVVPINRQQRGAAETAEARESPDAAPPAQAELSSDEPAPNQIEEETTEVEMPVMPAAEQTPAVPPPSSPEDIAFQSLKLPERFWTRLNALVKDEELSEWLKTEESLSPPANPFDEQNDVRDPRTPESKTVLDWEAQEIVVDDEPSEPAPPSNLRRLQSISPPGAESANPALLPEDEPVPVPVLELPKENLTAGRAVAVGVKLPEILPRIYVKVWLQDRQTRSVLDGPYWLTEFSSSIWGKQEATVQLTVPYGIMQVQIEAIAMEMQTQRESHKVSIDRQVIVPGPPSLPLE